MIGVKRRLLQNLGRNKTVKFDTFTLQEKSGEGILQGEDSMNCELEKKGLSCGMGVLAYKTPLGQELVVGENLQARKVYPLYAGGKGGGSIEDFFFLFTRNGRTYSCRYVDGESAWTEPVTSSPSVAAVYAMKPDGNIITLLISAAGCKYQDVNGFFSSKAYQKSRGIACYCKNRVFVVSGDKKITYSDPAEPLEATREENDGGEILRTLDGEKIVDLAANEDTVYVFYRHNITKLTVTGDPREFVVRVVGYTGGEIYGGSVVRVGKWIVFLAFDGIYRFDGEKAERICEYLGVKSTTENPSFGCGRYMDKALISYLDESDVLRTVAIDPERKTGYFISPLEGLTECNGRTLCVVNRKVMLLDEQGGNPSGSLYYFKSKAIDFGSAERKTLKTVRLKGRGYIVLSVFADGKEYSKILNLDSKESFSPMVRGKEFAFKISLNSGAKVESVEADVAFLKR